MINTINTGKNLKILRKERGLRQQDIASYVGVTKAAVSNWERGTTMPTIANLVELGKFYNVFLEDLIVEDGYGNE